MEHLSGLDQKQEHNRLTYKRQLKNRKDRKAGNLSECGFSPDRGSRLFSEVPAFLGALRLNCSFS